MTALPFLIAVCPMMAGPIQPIAVDEKKQLFLDDYLVASRSNVTRQVHPARKYAGNPVLWPTESWEPAFAVTWPFRCFTCAPLGEDPANDRIVFAYREGQLIRDPLHSLKPDQRVRVAHPYPGDMVGQFMVYLSRISSPSINTLSKGA